MKPGSARKGGHWYNWEDPTRSTRALIRRLETQNSIMCGFDVWHAATSAGEHSPPAWTEGRNITFNLDKLPRADAHDDIVFITGVNYHELGHVFYSPTAADIDTLYPGAPNVMLMGMRNSVQYRDYWNILEDQRIETLMVKRYPRMYGYLLKSFTRVVLSNTDPEHLRMAYLLARGRRYLPVYIRRYLKRRFKFKKQIQEFRRIIDEYVTLNLLRPQGMYRADQLVREFMALCGEPGIDNEPQQLQGRDHRSCGASDHVMKGRVPSDIKEAMDEVRDRKRIDREVEAVADDIAKEKAKSAVGEADAADGEDTGEGTPDASRRGSGDPDGPEDDGSDALDHPATGEADSTARRGTGDIAGNPLDTDSSGGESAGGGYRPSFNPGDPANEEELLAAVAAEIDLTTLGAEVAQAMKAIRVGQDSALLEPLRETRKISDEMPGIARRTATALRILESENESSWERGTNRGKLNVSRVIQHPNDRDHAFDLWQDGGSTGVDQEWVVLLDCSGSMDRQLGLLSASAWVMKRAADLVEARMTVLAYGSADYEKTVYTAEDKATLQEQVALVDLGGTEPQYALLEAYRLLSASSRAQKGMLVMTDGSWFGGGTGVPNLDSSEQIIGALNKVGVLTHLAYIGGRTTINAHACQSAERLASVAELPLLMKRLIAGRIRKTR